MVNELITKIKAFKANDRNIFFFFVFGSLFITFRLLLLGSGESNNFFEYGVSILPELFVFMILLQFIRNILFENQKLSLHRYDLFFLLFIITNVLIGLFIGMDIKLGIYGFRLTYLPMLFYFLGSLTSSTKQVINELIDIIFKWLTIIGLLGLIIYFCFPGFNYMMLKKVSYLVPEYFIIRLTSLFWSPVVFGSFSVLTFLYFYYKSLTSTTFWNYIFQSVLFVCTLMSMSRGPIITLVLGVILLSILARKWKKMVATFGLISVLFLPITVYIDSPKTVIVWVLTSTGDTIKMKKGVTRVDLATSAFGEIKANPFGRGLGKSGHVATRFSKSTHNSSKDLAVTATDCWFIKLLSESGIQGLLFYLLISLYLTILSVRYLWKHKFDFFGFLFTVFFVVNVQNLVSNVLDFYLFSYLYWFLIGVMVFYLKSKKEIEVS